MYALLRRGNPKERGHFWVHWRKGKRPQQTFRLPRKDNTKMSDKTQNMGM
jgi:hypothetical protein